MTPTPFSAPPPKAPSTKTDVQKTWRKFGWKPSKRQRACGATPTDTKERTPA